MYVRQLALGAMKNFVHLVGPGQGVEVAVVDPAWDVDAILAAVHADGRQLVAAFVTHAHHDHVNGLGRLLSACDVPVYVQRDELPRAELLRPFAEALRPVGPGEVVPVGALPVTCLHTPGHTPGSQCLSCGGALFTGDTLFVNACGRCDLPGGDAGAMHRSLHEVLAGVPDETVVYPGHDYGDVPVSTMGRERRRNPYFQLTRRDDFVQFRLRPR